MALQGSGAISLANIQTEFGGSNPISLSEYYQAGTYVSEHSSSVPVSGAIDLADFYGTEKAVRIVVSSNTTNYNILTSATAAGYNNSTAQPIVVIVNSGVEVSGSGTHGMRTGALHADTDLIIICNGTISGAHGGTNSGGADAIYFETTTGGSGTYEVRNSGLIRGGGGGGGNAGVAEDWEEQDGGGNTCSNSRTGSVGATGGFGAAGGNGSWNAGTDGDAIANCTITAPGSGGAAGYAVRKNGRTVTTSGSGTFTGATS